MFSTYVMNEYKSIWKKKKKKKFCKMQWVHPSYLLPPYLHCSAWWEQGSLLEFFFFSVVDTDLSQQGIFVTGWADPMVDMMVHKLLSLHWTILTLSGQVSIFLSYSTKADFSFTLKSLSDIILNPESLFTSQNTKELLKTGYLCKVYGSCG